MTTCQHHYVLATRNKSVYNTNIGLYEIMTDIIIHY